jgi:hypothetical protein
MPIILIQAKVFSPLSKNLDFTKKVYIKKNKETAINKKERLSSEF